MSAIPRRSYVLTLLLVAVTAGAYVVASLRTSLAWSGEEAFVAVLLAAMILTAEILDVNLPHPVANFSVSVTAALALASGLALGPLVGGVVVMTAMVLEGIYARRQAIKTVVNVANHGLATAAAGGSYLVLADPDASSLGSPRNLLSLVVAGLVFTLINSTTLALIVAPIVGTTPWMMWRANLGGVAVEIIALPALGGLVPVLAEQHPLSMLFLIAPLVGPHLSFKGFQKAQQETRATMERLADALERRDQYTHNHSVRVAEYVAGILHEMPQIPFEIAESIRAAARVHDLGKVGISDIPLNKCGPLSVEERREIEQHPVIGAEIIDRLEVYRNGAAMVRHHHERWDGRGYPDGIGGDDIPLGARVIAVADTFDAMTSDRAYRRAMSAGAALAEIRRQSGTQFDPQVVAAFERFLSASAPVTAVPEPAPAPAPMTALPPREREPALTVVRSSDARPASSGGRTVQPTGTGGE